MQPLTGRDAIEAIRTLSRLHASGASFNSRRVMAAVRNRYGRARLNVAIDVSRGERVVAHARVSALIGAGRPRRRAARRLLRAPAALVAPARPSGPPEPQRGSYGL